MKWTKASLLKMYSDWSVLSGTSEDIVRRGGNGDTETSFYEYLDMMHEKEHNEEPMWVWLKIKDSRFVYVGGIE